MTRVLNVGRNCCGVAHAPRLFILIDAASYYGVLADVIQRARRSVMIVGWDLDSRVSLVPDGPPLRELLPAVAARNPELNIYILNWEFPLIFANVRDPMLVLGRDPFQHSRVHLSFDGTEPAGASHHQKLVVIDDRLAFIGGMDIAGGRWDTPEHLPADSRRGDPPYPPYHDVQAMVDGQAAGALAAIARERWLRATGAALREISDAPDPAPPSMVPDLSDVDIAI